MRLCTTLMGRPPIQLPPQKRLFTTSSNLLILSRHNHPNNNPHHHNSNNYPNSRTSLNSHPNNHNSLNNNSLSSCSMHSKRNLSSLTTPSTMSTRSNSALPTNPIFTRRFSRFFAPISPTRVPFKKCMPRFNSCFSMRQTCWTNSKCSCLILPPSHVLPRPTRTPSWHSNGSLPWDSDVVPLPPPSRPTSTMLPSFHHPRNALSLLSFPSPRYPSSLSLPFLIIIFIHLNLEDALRCPC